MLSRLQRVASRRLGGHYAATAQAIARARRVAARDGHEAGGSERSSAIRPPRAGRRAVRGAVRRDVERVGGAHGLRVDAAGMAAAGIAFYLAGNGVWLTDAVPPEFLGEITRPGRR